MNCVILYRINSGPVEAVMEYVPAKNDYRVKEYANFDEAVAFSERALATQ
jgi:hypothetical protein